MKWALKTKATHISSDWLVCELCGKVEVLPLIWDSFFLTCNSKMLMLMRLFHCIVFGRWQGEFRKVKTKLITHMIWEQVIWHRKRIKLKPYLEMQHHMERKNGTHISFLVHDWIFDLFEATKSHAKIASIHPFSLLPHISLVKSASVFFVGILERC